MNTYFAFLNLHALFCLLESLEIRSSFLSLLIWYVPLVCEIAKRFLVTGTCGRQSYALIFLWHLRFGIFHRL